jgi:hypothetical protein
VECFYALRVHLNEFRYLFTTLLLAVHFNVGFVQTTDKGLESIITFGPLVLTLCAALMSIPFRRRTRRTNTNIAMSDLPTHQPRETSLRRDENLANISNTSSNANSFSESDVDLNRIAAGVTGFTT